MIGHNQEKYQLRISQSRKTFFFVLNKAKDQEFTISIMIE